MAGKSPSLSLCCRDSSIRIHSRGIVMWPDLGGFCFLYILIGIAIPALSISDLAMSSGIHASTARSLLQAQKGCPVSFESMNYTGIMNDCKGPEYPKTNCCDAFKRFACPYVDEINDLTTTCSNTMFSYINLYGHYPPGLFSNKCIEGKEGLDCTEMISSRSGASDAHTCCNLMFITSFFMLSLFLVV